MRILISGASGFVGRHLYQNCLIKGWDAHLAVREQGASNAQNTFAVGSINASTDWSKALKDCHAVVHLAARTPFQVNDASYEDVNVEGTKALVEQAYVEPSVKTMIFLSSVAVYGARVSLSAIEETTPLHPTEDYGKTKLEAEKIVLQFQGDGRSAICLRPPLIYGAGASGNWRAIEKLAALSVPLPLASVNNQRSMIYIENLCAAIISVLEKTSPNKSGSYVVADPNPVSLRAIIEGIRKGLGRPPRLFPFPKQLMSGSLKIIGKDNAAESLFGNLTLNAAKFESTFDWVSPYTSEDALEEIGRKLASDAMC